MQVKELQISRTASYDTPANTIVGVVNLTSEYGEQKIRLSSVSISKIFELIKQDVQKTASRNASMVSEAIENGAAEPLLEAPGSTELLA